MKSISKLTVMACLGLILAGCTLEEGNPDLAGSWTCTETSEIFVKSTKGTSVYTVTLKRDAANFDKYYIDNFYKLGNGVRVAVIKSGYLIDLPKQSVDGFVFEGTGEVNETFNIIQLYYTADDGGGVVDHVTAEYAR